MCKDLVGSLHSSYIAQKFCILLNVDALADNLLAWIFEVYRLLLQITTHSESLMVH